MKINTITKKTGSNSSNGSDLSKLQGSLFLYDSPSGPLEAAPKQYIDLIKNFVSASNITSGTISVERLPGFTGDLISLDGTNELILIPTGVNSGTYTRVSVDVKGRVTTGLTLREEDIPELSWNKIVLDKPTTLSGYGINDLLSKGNSVMQGFLTLNNNPTSDNHLATKEYVDSLLTNQNQNGMIRNIGEIFLSTDPVINNSNGFSLLKCNGGQLEQDTYPQLYSVVGDEYTNIPYLGLGQPWFQQYYIKNNTDSLVDNYKVETTGTIHFESSTFFVTKNRIYVFGGYINGSNSDINTYTATINETTGVISEFTNSGVTFPAIDPNIIYKYIPNFSTTVVTFNNKVYLLGGYCWINSPSYVNRDTGLVILESTINPDGTIGNWSYSNSKLPAPIADGEAFIIKNRLYVMCGINSETTFQSYALMYAIIDSNGNFSDWNIVEDNAIPYVFNKSSLIITEKYIHIIGGHTHESVDKQVESSRIYSAQINGDGTLGQWFMSGLLPFPLHNSKVIVTRHYAYLVLGYIKKGTYTTYNPNTSGAQYYDISNEIYKIKINEDSTLGSISLAYTSPTYFDYHSVLSINNKILILGGSKLTPGPWGFDYENNYDIVSIDFYGGLNDYSSYYGAVTPVNSTIYFNLPNINILNKNDIYAYIFADS